ncbi:MAG: hypothetical protein WA659_06550 [Candidatus Aquirickettsiella sp.]
MKENSKDISGKSFQQSNKDPYYLRPSPKVLPIPNKFDTLVYVADAMLGPKEKSDFKHSVTSPFQPVVPGKK